MKYCNTNKSDGKIVVVTVLPLSEVPFFDPCNPPDNACLCNDDVEPGWVQGDGYETFYWGLDSEKEISNNELKFPIFCDQKLFKETNAEFTLRDFSSKYVRDGFKINHDLFSNVYLTDVSTSVLVQKSELFMVEMYFMHPHANVVPHSHPFESVAIHWSGDLKGGRNGVDGPWLSDRDRGFIGPTLMPGDTHYFEVGEGGAVFFVASKWDDESQMDSATVRYFGAPMGPKHAESMGKVA